MTEQQPYEVVKSYPGFEVRRYPPHVVAEIDVVATLEKAGNAAFRPLAAFIGGKNSTVDKIAMTAPVVQTKSAKIAMTAPVVQRPGSTDGRYAVSFVMPAKYTIDTVPQPTDPRVRLREVPGFTAAVLRYSGRWSQKEFEEKSAELRALVLQQGLVIDGPMQWARFNPPWTPWFLRRNEIVAPIKA